MWTGQTRRVLGRCFTLVVALSTLLGCHGATVDAPPIDAAPDGETGDAATADTGSADVADAMDASDPCRPSGNLLENGDFSTGTGEWLVDRATLTVGAGPCAGKGATVKTTGPYGGVGRRLDRPTAKGTRLRLRVFVRSLTTTRAPPEVYLRTIRVTDAGEETPELFSLTAAGAVGEFALVEKGVTLDADVLGFMLGVASRSSDVPDEFGVAGASLAIE